MIIESKISGSGTLTSRVRQEHGHQSARYQNGCSEDDSPNHIDNPTKQNQVEVNGPKGPEPTRYGDWEVKGRCSDF